MFTSRCFPSFNTATLTRTMYITYLSLPSEFINSLNFSHFPSFRETLRSMITLIILPLPLLILSTNFSFPLFRRRIHTQRTNVKNFKNVNKDLLSAYIPAIQNREKITKKKLTTPQHAVCMLGCSSDMVLFSF